LVLGILNLATHGERSFGMRAFHGHRHRSFGCWWVVVCLAIISASPALAAQPVPTAHAFMAQPPAISAASTSLNTVGTIGGSVNAVDAVGSIAYVGEGPLVTVLNISDPARPVRIANVLLSGLVTDIAVASASVYATSTDGALSIIDVADAQRPVLRSTLPLADFAARDVEVRNGRAYVLSDGMQVVDVRNPASPTVLGSIKTAQDFRALDVEGSFAYVVELSTMEGTAGLQIIDVSNPAKPALRGRIDVPRPVVSDVDVAGIYAYLTLVTGEVQVIDISNPDAPVVRTSIPVSPITRDVEIVGTFAYITVEVYTETRIDAELRIFDVSNPLAPVARGRVQVGGEVFALRVIGTKAYIAGGARGLHIVDVADAAHPTLRGRFTTVSRVDNVVVDGQFAYVANADASTGGLYIIDLGDPQQPRLRGSIATLPTDAVAVSGNLVVVAGSRINLADPSQSAHELVVVDVSNPDAPVRRSTYTQAGPITDLEVLGNVVYATVSDDATNTHALRIFDISNPTIIAPRGSYAQLQSATALEVSAGVAYIADFDNGLQIVDVRNPDQPKLYGKFTATSSVNNLEVVGGVAYLAAGDNGLQIVDVRNPASPVLRGNIVLPAADYANGVAVAGGTAYITGAYTNQLYALDVRNAAQPALLTSRTIPGFPSDVRAVNDIIVVAANEGGLQIFRARPDLPRKIYAPLVAR
jgi:hypothetical protein